MSQLFRNKTALFGIFILVVFVLFAVLSQWIVPYDPLGQALRDRMKPPSINHLMGTDIYGRDIWSRVIWGAQISLLVGFLAVLVGGAIGIATGLISGFLGGTVDLVIMRIVEAMLSLPAILIALVIVAITGTGSILGVILAVGLSNAPRFALLIRAEVLAVRSREYVTAAAALGASRIRIMTRHILPNIMPSILVLATLRVGDAILAEASISFLGFGPQPPTVSWGAMIADGRNMLRNAPWISLFPAAAIMMLVVGFNLLGDALVDILDPKRRQRRG